MKHSLLDLLHLWLANNIPFMVGNCDLCYRGKCVTKGKTGRFFKTKYYHPMEDGKQVVCKDPTYWMIADRYFQKGIINNGR